MHTVEIKALTEGMISAETVHAAGGLVVLMPGVVLKQSVIDQLTKIGIKQLSIIDEYSTGRSAEEAAVFSTVAGHFVGSITAMLQDEALNAVFHFENNACKINQIVQSVLSNPKLQDHLTLLEKSDEVYIHTLHTTLLAVHMGLVNNYDYLNMEVLGTCVLLHDIGKVSVHPAHQALHMEDTKDSPTNEHVFSSYLALRDNLDLPMLVALVGLQHHEHFDGHGSPFGLKKNQITEFARLLAVVDVYDNLLFTLKNTSRQAMFKILSHSDTQFDSKMVDLFSKAVCAI